MPADITHLHSIFEFATEGIVLTGDNGRIVLANPATERIFGYAEGELIDQPIEILIPDNVKPHHDALREGFYHHPSNREMGHGRDLYAVRKDGTAIPVEVSLSHYTRNNQLYVIAFIVDISRRKEIEKNVISQQAELARMQELNEIKSRFVSMASHEFRTPLSTVLSSASLLSKYTEGNEQEKRDRHINRIKSSVKQLNDILEDFLSLGRLDEGRVTTTITSFDLKEVLMETVDELQALLKPGQTITLETTTETTEQICSDQKLVKNIVTNLLTNASKFSAEGKEISLGAAMETDSTVITVRDQGIGISQDDQSHLFDSFFRGANATNIQGTGLGLPIVRRYVDLLGGSIKIESELDYGTTISISLPNKSGQ